MPEMDYVTESDCFNLVLCNVSNCHERRAEHTSVQVCGNMTSIHWVKTTGIYNRWVCVAK